MFAPLSASICRPVAGLAARQHNAFHSAITLTRPLACRSGVRFLTTPSNRSYRASTLGSSSFISLNKQALSKRLVDRHSKHFRGFASQPFDNNDKKQNGNQQHGPLSHLLGGSGGAGGVDNNRREEEEKNNLISPPTIGDPNNDNGKVPKNDEENEEKPGKISKALSRMGVVGTGLLFIGGKTKYLLVGLKLTKFSTLASMMVTVGTYSIFFGLPYAGGMVGLILVHELGHALAMKHYNIPFGPTIFVPFMGAAINMEKDPAHAYEEAMVAIGGPVLGTVGAAGTLAAALATDSQLLFALADFGFMINLFNLMPIGSMDGGRILGALSRWFLVAGLVGGAGLIYTGFIANPLFYLIMLLAGVNTYGRFFGEAAALAAAQGSTYYKFSNGQRMGIGAGYLALVAVLLGLMAVNSKYKLSPQELARRRQLETGEEDNIFAEGSYAKRVQDMVDSLDDDDEGKSDGGFESGLPSDFFYVHEEHEDHKLQAQHEANEKASQVKWR